MSIDKYKIRKQAQIPSRVNLYDPATNKPTEDWIEVRSSLSDEFTETRDSIMQEIQSISEPNKDRRKKIVADLQLSLKVSLVAGWSFDHPFTKENVTEFLREAPQVQALIMSVADESARFFNKPSNASSDGRTKK